MRLAIAAGIFALCFPPDAAFAGAKRNDRHRAFQNKNKNHNPTGAIAATNFGRRLGKQNRKSPGTSSSITQGRRNNGPFAVLKNQGEQGAIERTECDPVAAFDANVGVLACGMGHYCQESEDSKLGGVCIGSTTPIAFDRNLQVSFAQNFCNAYFICDCSEYDSANQTGSVSCGPLHYYNNECDPRLCYSGSDSLEVFVPRNFTFFSCYEWIGGPYPVKACSGDFTAIYMDGVQYNNATILPVGDPDADENCYIFDCTNTVKNAAGSICDGDASSCSSRVLRSMYKFCRFV
jgi:hypothetical protein